LIRSFLQRQDAESKSASGYPHVDCQVTVANAAESMFEPEEDPFEVEAILDRKDSVDGSTSYLVKYKDFLRGEGTAWQDAKQLTCSDLIRNFNNAR
jgi:hypothetical protein